MTQEQTTEELQPGKDIYNAEQWLKNVSLSASLPVNTERSTESSITSPGYIKARKCLFMEVPPDSVSPLLILNIQQLPKLLRLLLMPWPLAATARNMAT